VWPRGLRLSAGWCGTPRAPRLLAVPPRPRFSRPRTSPHVIARASTTSAPRVSGLHRQHLRPEDLMSGSPQSQASAGIQLHHARCPPISQIQSDHGQCAAFQPAAPDGRAELICDTPWLQAAVNTRRENSHQFRA